MSELWGLVAVFFLVFLNGFFVATEFALVTVRKTRIEQLSLQGVKSADAVKRALIDLDRYVAGTQVGITIASLALGWVGEPAVAHLLAPVFALLGVGEVLAHTVSVGVGFTVVTILHVVFGELVPKSIALQRAESTSLSVARPMSVVVKLLQPLIWTLNGIGNKVLKLFGLHASEGHDMVHSAEELTLLVKQSAEAGHLDQFEEKILQKTFRFSETAVSVVMVPRVDVVGIDINDDPAEITKQLATIPFSRIPVYDGDRDNVKGVLYLQDAYRSHFAGTNVNVAQLMRKPVFVPETLPLDEMVQRFRKNKAQFAIAVDEHGGMAGIVTAKDVVETVFGVMQDQNETLAAQPVTTNPDGSFTIQGDARMVEIQEAVGKTLSDKEETMAMFILREFQEIPTVGFERKVEEGTLKVLKMEQMKIAEVLYVPLKQEGEAFASP